MRLLFYSAGFDWRCSISPEDCILDFTLLDQMIQSLTSSLVFLCGKQTINA